MGRIRVERGEVRTVAQGARLEQPMRWAVSKTAGAATYVGWLETNQNGNACGCQCPSCGEDLQAVNVGKEASHFLKAKGLSEFLCVRLNEPSLIS